MVPIKRNHRIVVPLLQLVPLVRNYPRIALEGRALPKPQRGVRRGMLPAATATGSIAHPV
jgi:hypothetical protein